MNIISYRYKIKEIGKHISPCEENSRFNLLTTFIYNMEKGMATHSSILAWRIPWTEEPGGPQSMGPQRVGQD